MQNDYHECILDFPNFHVHEAQYFCDALNIRFVRRNMTYTDISDSKHGRSKIGLSTRNRYFSLELQRILFHILYFFLGSNFKFFSVRILALNFRINLR